VVLRFLAVEAVADVVPVVFVERHRGRDDQRDALVRRAEQDIEVRAEPLPNGLCVEARKPPDVRARAIAARVHEVRRLAARLGREIAEREHVAADHQLDQLALVGLHGCGE
jgi:hypothetical protein